jgi:hypothetical protein
VLAFSVLVSEPGWRAEADRWIVTGLQEAGLFPVGPPEQRRVRPWSTHLVVPTSGGRVWFKANCRDLSFEPALQQLLARLAPGRVDTPLARETAAARPTGHPSLEGAALLAQRPGLPHRCDRLGCISRRSTRRSDHADSTVYATYRRFAQIMRDAMHDGIIPRSPCSRKTSPGGRVQRPLGGNHGAGLGAVSREDEHLRSVPPGRLRWSEDGRDVRASGVRCRLHARHRGPTIQWPAEPLKSECSKTPVPIPPELALELAAGVKRYVGETVVSDELRQACSP